MNAQLVNLFVLLNMAFHLCIFISTVNVLDQTWTQCIKISASCPITSIVPQTGYIKHTLIFYKGPFQKWHIDRCLTYVEIFRDSYEYIIKNQSALDVTCPGYYVSINHIDK